MYKALQLPTDSAAKIEMMLETLAGYLDSDLPAITNFANMTAVLNEFMTDINWVGFYLFEGGRLILGPFQGRPACTSIALGKGVCGTAAQLRTTLIVTDVAKFPGHIACDDASRSEIVVPILKNDILFGVLDVDSPTLDRFAEPERIALEKAVDLLIDKL